MLFRPKGSSTVTLYKKLRSHSHAASQIEWEECENSPQHDEVVRSRSYATRDSTFRRRH